MRQRTPTREWPIRLAFILLGGLLAAAGLGAVHNGKFWIVGYNVRLGRVGIAPTLGFAVFGLLFVILGIVPWPKDPGKPQKNKWKTHA
jgi:hypothetical protein